MRKGKVMLLVVVCVIVCVVVAAIIIRTPNYAGIEKGRFISAMEGRPTADKVAKEWHNDALLVESGSMDNHDANGRASKWYYKYLSPSTSIMEDNVTKYERAFIYVTPEHQTTIETAFRVIDEIGEPLINWTIDSDQAVKIAKKNSQINAFLSKYSDAQIGLNIRMDEEFSNNNAIWFIGWFDPGVMDNPHNGRAIIDAHNGEVLYVEVQM